MLHALILIWHRLSGILVSHTSLQKVSKLLGTIGCEVAGRDTEHHVEFFEGLVFRLRTVGGLASNRQTGKQGNLQEEQHQEESDRVPSRIPTERTRLTKRLQQRRPSNRKHKVKKPTSRSRKTHTLRTDIQRIRLGRVRKWHRSLSHTVNNSEQVNSQSHTGDSRITVFGNQETETSEEEAEGHEWEGGEEEVATAEGVDCEEGGDGEKEVQGAETHGCAEGGELGEVGFEENLGRIVGDDVDAAELEGY